MTHAEMESLNAATKPPVSAPAALSLSLLCFFHDYFTQFWIILSVSSGLNHVDESLPFLLLLSLFFRISFFVGPGHSVEHLLLSLWLLFQCELLPTNYPFTNTLFLPFCPLFLLLLLLLSLLLSLLLPPLLLLHHLSIRPSCSWPPLHLSLATSTSLSLSLSLCLPLLSSRHSRSWKSSAGIRWGSTAPFFWHNVMCICR